MKVDPVHRPDDWRRARRPRPQLEDGALGARLCAGQHRQVAIRAVTGARALAPNLGERMIGALDKAVVLRELMPQDLKLEGEHLTQDEAGAMAAYLVGVVGRAHGRQLDVARRDAWRKELRKAHTATLEAPSRLWSRIVEPVSVHEGAHLDYCRSFALSEAA